MQLSTGTKLGTFEILGLLGVGGMGEVYRARDTKLGREVAIKVLPEAFAANPERLARFEREAQMLAALDHPNIGALHEFRHENDVHFLVMQLVEGDTLAERLARGPLSVSDAIPIFAQIAEALEAAHEHGIVHRDLKPANIKISRDGKVKVLDFGMAKPQDPVRSSSPTATTRISSDDPTKVTTDGTILGTPSYMSPEQARGEEVDTRADIWAFGCCLYETLTGKVPFKGPTVAETIASILERNPDWGRLPSDMPEPVRRILRRSLQKELRDRLRDIGDARIDLQELHREREAAADRDVTAEAPGSRMATMVLFAAAGLFLAALFIFGVTLFNRNGADEFVEQPAVQKPIRSLVVLPFDNLMGDPEQEYFVDGMTDALSAELGKIRALKVISRSSAMRYKDTDKPLPQIADELGVEGLVEGSIFRSGNEVRITAQLIDGATDLHLWAESYDGTMTNILALQKEVAMAIAQAIRITVTPEEETRITSVKPVDPKAYEAFLRGRFFHWKLTPDGFQKAIESFQRAVELDPGFAEAHSWLGFEYWLPSIFGLVPSAEAVARARPRIDKALALDDSLASAHASVGQLARAFDWDWPRAERELLRAIELDPGWPEGHDALALYYASLGRFDDAIRETQEAIDLDPLNFPFGSNLAVWYAAAGRYEEAIARHEKVLELDPAYLLSLRSASLDYIILSRHDEAIELIDRGMAIYGRLPLLLGQLVWAHAAAGRRVEAEALLAELHARDQDEYIEATTFALAYAALGDMDEAFRWTDRAIEDRNFLLSFPYWTGWHLLRGDPRFIDMLRRINYPAIAAFETAMQNPAFADTVQTPVD